jgi:branched-chain amino acid transport system permease protein
MLAPPQDTMTFRVTHMDRSSRFGLALWTVLLVGLAALPFYGDRQAMRLLTEIYSYIALASLWNLLAGYAGLVSIGQQVFVGVGGYTLYVGALSGGLPPLLCVPLGGLLCGVLAVPIVLLLFRLRGAYFTIGSWVIAELFLQIFQQVREVGGGSGISLPASVVKSIAQSRDSREFLIYWLFLGLLVAVIGLISATTKSRPNRTASTSIARG